MDGRSTPTKRDTSPTGELVTSMHTGPKQSIDLFSLYVLFLPITGHVMILQRTVSSKLFLIHVHI